MKTGPARRPRWRSPPDCRGTLGIVLTRGWANAHVAEQAIVLGDGWGFPVWTGDEVIVPGAAAYSPETNKWRRLANAPGERPRNVVWTGETTLMTLRTVDPVPGSAPGRYSLVRYDPGTDAWQIVDDERSYASLVAVPDADGEVRSVLALPTGTGAPVAVLDRAGNAIGTLPGHPGDRATFGDQIEAEWNSMLMPVGRR